MRIKGVLALILGLAVGHAGLANDQPHEAVTGEKLAGHIDTDTVDRLFREHISDNPADGLATGAQLAIVDSAGRKYIKGYGVAGSPDAARPAMDPARHLYRIASQTKVFTAIGILQLYERGSLVLDDPVNDYLTAIQLENPRGGGPITFRHLLQHNSGLDDDWVGLALRSQEEHRTLEEAISQRGIRFARPVGEFVSYTNRAYMLLGYLIEEISGLAYEDYIQRNILDVLEMDDSTFELTPGDKENLAMGVQIRDGEFQEIWVADTLTRPSGDLMTTAEDMSHFLVALLGDGSYRNRRLLMPETLRMMFEDCRLMAPRLPGACLGPGRFVRDGIAYWLHGGGHPGYHSRFIVDREGGFALFFGFVGPADATEFYESVFLETFYPGESTAMTPVSIDNTAQIAGLYRPTWSSFETAEKLGFLFGGDQRIDISDNQLIIPPYHYVQVEPGLFRAREIEKWVQLQPDKNGNFRYIQQGRRGLVKLGWYESALLHRTVMYFCMAALFIYLLWQVRGLFQGRLFNSAPVAVLHCFTLTATLGWLLVLGLLQFYPSDFSKLQYGYPSVIRMSLTLAPPVAMLSAIAVVCTVAMLPRRGFSAFPRVMHSTAAFIFLLLTAWAWYWNVI